MTIKNLTQYETFALQSDFNLADAHTHQQLSLLEKAVVSRLPSLFEEAARSKQHTLDEAAIKGYHELCGQVTANSWAHSHLCYSASMAMEVVANYLRLQRKKLLLIEPTFDNIADILKRHQIPLMALSDAVIATPHTINWRDLLSDYAGEAVFLTLPNNPTGTFLTPPDFEALAKSCQQMDILLIIDSCFRIYEPDYFYDQYEILRRFDTKCLIIEDTGKIWPALDLKFSILNAHPALAELIYDIHSDFLLNVSPFILRLLPEFFHTAKTDGFSSIRELAKINRGYLRDNLTGTFLEVAFPHSRISVEFLRINAPITGLELRDYLAQHNIHVLSGDMFFWHRPELGFPYIRLALARDFTEFKVSFDKLLAAIQRLKLPAGLSGHSNNGVVNREVVYG